MFPAKFRPRDRAFDRETAFSLPQILGCCDRHSAKVVSVFHVEWKRSEREARREMSYLAKAIDRQLFRPFFDSLCALGASTRPEFARESGWRQLFGPKTADASKVGIDKIGSSDKFQLIETLHKRKASIFPRQGPRMDAPRRVCHHERRPGEVGGERVSDRRGCCACMVRSRCARIQSTFNLI